ncbi:orotate phosphoribosyltransferase [Paenimyroides aestuarii]|uniref:Orotate phosphoribosyltransferase n=1 Tax=Paenimyroides aestuarii TaxID=2968490 RepID=A0ABY5NTE6_9FLAO|nr:orotate phosphoribosyltransferase [Paenimyroides aestuarii]UUV21672.1 orotate phosphoribosyltransferase [Paenimyroides aestuarii]
MIFNDNTAQKTAELLLQINAIKLNPKNPFTWASGWKSPIYCDNRITLSFPEIRKFLKNEFAANIVEKFGKPDYIAGVATGAIGIGLLVAEALELPFVYVRPEPKKHGRQNQIEGQFEAGKTVVVVEDLISTGKSSLQAVDALRNANAQILGMAAIFTYGFDVATENFKNADIQLVTLSNYPTLLKAAVEKKYISQEEVATLSDWSKDPSVWGV